MRFDDFMYGGDMYGGDMFGAYGGAALPSFAVEPPYYAPEPTPYYAPEQSYYAPEPTPYYAPEQSYYAPEPTPYYAPEQSYYAPEPTPYYAPEPTPYYAPEPTPYYAPEPAPSLAVEPATYSGQSVAQEPAPSFAVEPPAPAPSLSVTPPVAAPMAAPMAAPPEAAPFTLTPEMTADIQRRAQLSMAPNAAFGLSSMDPGVLSKADPLFEYAQTAPVLELKGNKEHETLKFQPLPDTNYKLVVGGKDLGTGSTPEQVAALVNAANEISKAGGKMVDVRLQKETQYADKAGGVQTAFADVYANQKNNAGALEFIVPAILAAASAGVLAPALAPALGASLGISQAAASTLAAGLAAGAGTTTGKLALGSSLKDALIQGGLSGLTAGVMQGTGLTDALKGALGGASAGGGPQLSDAFNAARGAGGALTDVFATSGLDAIGSAAGQAAAQTIGQAAPAAIGGGLSQAIPSEIVVSALKGAAPSLLSQVAPSVVQAGVSNLGQSLLPSPQATTQTPLAAQEPPPSFAVSPDELAGITVTGSVPSSNAFPSLAAGVSGVGNLGLKSATDQIAAEQQAAEQQRADEDRMITVTSTTPPPSSAVVPSLAVPAMAALPSLAAATAQPTPATTTAPPEEKPLTVTASKLSPSIIPSVAAAALPPLATALTPATPASTTPQDTLYTGDEPMITATATKVPTTLVPSVVTAAGGAALADALTTPEPATTTPDKKLSVSDYLRLAGLASSAIGLLGGGGGPEGTAAGIVPGGLGRLNPIFSAKLPTGADVNIPSGVGTASNLAARPMGDEDWLTYGQRPEKSFFNYVPQPPTGMAHGGSLAAKRGGRPSRSSFAVSGAGTGRSDDIPAVLSDGEYVIDAETVALLGDGSSKAGAKKLDDLRVKIRKHKGQRLSQGRFSSDAKKPEAYLTGGRI
jgi:hypothetical protein